MPPPGTSGPKSLGAFRKPALVMGHPGHELKVFGWMAECKPRVYVLTDGSGRTGISRLPSTARSLAKFAIEMDEVFGLISDRELYRVILERNTSWFLNALDRIAESFVENRIDLVVADAREGFNPAHDLCRALVDAAVLAVKCKTGRTISNYEFCLTEWERVSQEHHGSRCAHSFLDDGVFRKKMEVAEEYTELRDEVRAAIALRGKEYFRIECLKKIPEPFQEREYSEKPYYETWGERRVAEGTYESVIRYDEHIFPILDAIRNRAIGSEARAAVASVSGGHS